MLVVEMAGSEASMATMLVMLTMIAMASAIQVLVLGAKGMQPTGTPELQQLVGTPPESQLHLAVGKGGVHDLEPVIIQLYKADSRV